MATLKINLVEKVNNENTYNAGSQGSDTNKRANESAQRVNVSTQDRTHTNAVMDTDKNV